MSLKGEWKDRTDPEQTGMKGGAMEEPELENVLRDFRTSVRAWSDAIYARPRLVEAAPRRKSWRKAAAWALGEVDRRGKRSFRDLLQALADPDAVVSEAAAGALAQFAPLTEAQVPALRAAMGHDNTAVRSYAVRGLAQVTLPADDAIRLFAANGGWNLIGDPFTAPVSWPGVTVRVGGTIYTMEDAVARGVISSAAIGF